MKKIIFFVFFFSLVFFGTKHNLKERLTLGLNPRRNHETFQTMFITCKEQGEDGSHFDRSVNCCINYCPSTCASDHKVFYVQEDILTTRSC